MSLDILARKTQTHTQREKEKKQTNHTTLYVLIRRVYHTIDIIYMMKLLCIFSLQHT